MLGAEKHPVNPDADQNAQACPKCDAICHGANMGQGRANEKGLWAARSVQNAKDQSARLWSLNSV